MSEVVENKGGIGLMGVIGVLFIGLKLTGFIDWSWWWVLAPFWIPFLIIILVLVVFIIIGNKNN